MRELYLITSLFLIHKYGIDENVMRLLIKKTLFVNHVLLLFQTTPSISSNEPPGQQMNWLNFLFDYQVKGFGLFVVGRWAATLGFFCTPKTHITTPPPHSTRTLLMIIIKKREMIYTMAFLVRLFLCDDECLGFFPPLSCSLYIWLISNNSELYFLVIILLTCFFLFPNCAHLFSFYWEFISKENKIKKLR